MSENEGANALPGWIGEAVAELSRLRNPHRDKKQATIIALVDARISGMPEESIWKRTEVCSRTVYHEKWKKDATFADVLVKVEDLARNWRNTQAVTALSDASKILQLASPRVASGLVKMATEGYAPLDDGDSRLVETSEQLRAMVAVLDRASPETAGKSKAEVSGPDGKPIETRTTHDLSKLTIDELQALRYLTAKVKDESA